MTGKAHLTMGTFIGCFISYKMNLNAFDAAEVVGITMIASLTPDIDSLNSTISRRLPVISAVINSATGHRGVLHSALTVLLLWQFMKGNLLGCSFVAGYVGHLLQDLLTAGGIPLFFPLRKRIALLPFKTGGVTDWITTSLLIFVIIKFI